MIDKSKDGRKQKMSYVDEFSSTSCNLPKFRFSHARIKIRIRKWKSKTIWNKEKLYNVEVSVWYVSSFANKLTSVQSLDKPNVSRLIRVWVLYQTFCFEILEIYIKKNRIFLSNSRAVVRFTIFFLNRWIHGSAVSIMNWTEICHLFFCVFSVIWQT